MKHFDFWFSIGSTYTYLTVQRLETIEEQTGVKARWRPFSVRALMQEMNNVPFIGKPAKEKYMWRDFQRRAERYGISVKVPVAYPLQNFDLANRIAIVAEQEGWCDDYVRASYHYWMQEGMPAGDEPNIVASLKKAGQSYDRVLPLANSDFTGSAYQAATADARSLGIFGSPSFVVDGHELFWGDDRLEDAIEFWRELSTPG
jgi:2-hydroxychromene-2-carboxylate isomerase